MIENKYITAVELAERWRITTNALTKMRARGDGPPYTMPGGNILYSLADIEQFEADKSKLPIKDNV